MIPEIPKCAISDDSEPSVSDKPVSITPLNGRRHR